MCVRAFECVFVRVRLLRVAGSDGRGRVWLCAHACVAVCMRVCICACVCVRASACVFTCRRVYVRACLRSCVCLCVRVYLRLRVHDIARALG